MANTGNTQQQIDYGAAANDGTGDPLRTAFIKTDDNFDNIWLAGPVGSNITIINNTVQANDTNGNLILSPNGVGVIQTNSKLLPRLNNTYDLGSTALKYRAGHFGTGGLTVDGNVAITGNLTAGNISYTSNVFVGDLEGSVFADDSTIMVDAIDNVLYAGRAAISGNVSATYFIGNGSQLTGLAATYGNANVVANLAALGSNPVSTTGNISGNYFIGNGSQLTGMAATYGNANVVANLAALGSNPVSTTGNISGNYFIGNGSQLTGLAATYGNANVVANLAALGSNPVSTTGNISGNYFIGNGRSLTGITSSYGNANVVANLSALGSNPVSTTGNVTASYFIGNGSLLTGLPAPAVTQDITSNGAMSLMTYDGVIKYVNYATVEPSSGNIAGGNITTTGLISATGNVTGGNIITSGNVTGGNIVTSGSGGDITMTGGNITGAGNISAAGNITGNYFIGNGSQLTGITASVPSQTILPTIQTITVEARPAGLFGGGQGGANVTVANVIPVTEYGVIITDGTSSQKYATGSLGSIPGTVSLTFTTGLTSAPFTVYAYVTSNAGTYYSNAATGTSGICLLAGTQIALSDGTRKAIEHITYTDKMLSWDFDRGCYAETTAMWIKRGETGSQYNLLTFSDGTTLRTFDQHRIFNKQAGAFTYPMTDATPVGTVTVNEHGQEITLTNKQVIIDTIEYYNVITDHHMNLFSDTVLTSCRFNNIYPITDMKFVKDGRTLRTRAEFENIPDRFFYGLRLAEQTTAIETVEWYVNRLLSTEVSTESELTV